MPPNPSTLDELAAQPLVGAFFDDSGTHDGSPVLALGGVLGTGEQWDLFEREWQKILDAPTPGKPPLSHFHLVPCRHATGEFLDYNRAERDLITRRFRRVIIDLEMVTIAAALDKRAWEEFAVGDMQEAMGDPLGYCFVKCVDMVLNTIRARRPGEKLMLFFDQGIRLDLEQWARFYGSQSARYPEIAAITFAPVNKVVALQAADMIASETFYYAQEWLRDRTNTVSNPHFRDFLFRDLSTGLVLDREMIAELAQTIRNSVANAGE